MNRAEPWKAARRGAIYTDTVHNRLGKISPPVQRERCGMHQHRQRRHSGVLAEHEESLPRFHI